MGDPSERFGEVLDCGCEWHAGTVFYCEEHLPRPIPAGLCGHRFDSMVCVAPAGHDGPHVTSNASFPHGSAAP